MMKKSVSKAESKNRSKTEKKSELWCPYCDEEIMNSDLPFCQACKVVLFYCPNCSQPVERTKRTCPSCGANIKDYIDQDDKLT
jgi:predicted RNA-binding Zn-ribbon protein involved in translation (DUF1610 family)